MRKYIIAPWEFGQGVGVGNGTIMMKDITQITLLTSAFIGRNKKNIKNKV
nr:MAG TPA: hypothetical protein [Inoviridae sp.]